MKKILLPLLFLLTVSALAISAERPSSHWKNVTVDCTVTLPDNVVAGAAIVDNSIASAKIQDNTIAIAKINYTGTANATTYLRGDGSFATPTSTSTGLASYKGLVITTPADNQSVTVTADKVVVSNNQDVSVVLSSVSLTVNLDTSGANGLDNGSLAANTGYFLYVIYNGPVTAGLASTSATAPVMPSGYTYKALVGWCTTDNTSSPFNVEEFTQRDDEFAWMTPQKVFDGTMSTSTSAIDLSAGGALGYAVVPPSNVKVVHGRVRSVSGYYLIHPVTFANGMSDDNDVIWAIEQQPGGVWGHGSFHILPLEAQKLYHQHQSAQAAKTYITGFTFGR